MRLYWCSHGSSMRFYPQDMMKIWPKYFNISMDEIQSINSLSIWRQISKLKLVDSPYDKFCKFFEINDLDQQTNITDEYDSEICKMIKQKLDDIFPDQNVGQIFIDIKDKEDVKSFLVSYNMQSGEYCLYAVYVVYD